MTIKDNGDGTFGVIPTTWFQNDVWTACRGCGQRVTGDSIHTCSPQTKEWQYLTDDEIKEIVGSYGNGLGAYVRDLFNKIEAKIREKNEPTKSFSDEEIVAIYKKIHNWDVNLGDKNWIGLARAILEGAKK